MRLDHLAENKYYALAKQIFSKLSSIAQSQINSWEMMNWDKGELSQSFESDNEVAKEIYQAAQPIRDQIYRKHGNTITLYRGIDTTSTRGVRQGRMLFSWTSSKHMAEVFAGKDLRATKTNLTPITDHEIEAALKRYEQTGFTTFRNKKYKQVKNNPQYYDIYDRYNQFVTDGDNLAREFKHIQQYVEEVRDRMLNYKGRVVTKEIPVNDIIWVLMGGNANEYIVKGHPE